MTMHPDELIAEWGERLYYRPVQKRATKRSSSGLLIAVAAIALSVRVRADRVRRIAALTAKNAPEVMVKISSSSKGMNKIKAHFDYISRNGKVEMENENGESITGRESVRDLCDEWKSGLYGIPSEGVKREAFNIVLSMPPGTDRICVSQAAREFARSEFSGNHQYVLVTHDDERHPHVHLCVKAFGLDGTRLNPRKADLQRWRERFAETLRDRGIEANATPRLARGITRIAKRQSDIHKSRRNHDLPLQHTHDSTQMQKLMRAPLKAYEGMAHALARSSEVKDRQLAIGIVQFVRDMPGIDAILERKGTSQQKEREFSAQGQKTPGRDNRGPERE